MNLIYILICNHVPIVIQEVRTHTRVLLNQLVVNSCNRRDRSQMLAITDISKQPLIRPCCACWWLSNILSYHKVVSIQNQSQLFMTPTRWIVSGRWHNNLNHVRHALPPSSYHVKPEVQIPKRLVYSAGGNPAYCEILATSSHRS